MSAEEPKAAALTAVVLATPDGAELPEGVLRAFVEVDRKCGLFIFPQLRQLGAEDEVEQLVDAGRQLALGTAQGDPQALAALESGYRDLLARAQATLRRARTTEVRQEGEHRDQRQREVRLAAARLGAKARLPAARMARLEQRLGELGEGTEDQVAAVEAAVAEWDRLSQTRQSREAERLADRAHRVVLPRPQETARSRRARRDQAKVIELARAFTLEAPTSESGEDSDAAQ
ncbi:MAG: hypothetical protein ACRENY_01875 [Candidatus Dormibacteria bacterium]